MSYKIGLFYVGNGQHYDPATGRFLTWDANPTSPNPYVPFDPTSFLLAPLGLMAMVYKHKLTVISRSAVNLYFGK